MTDDVAFAVTQRGVIVLWNPAAEEMLGYSASAAIGQQCWKLLRGEDIFGNPYCSEHCTLRKMAFQFEPVNNYEVSYETYSEGVKRFLVKCLLVFNKAGNDLLLHICHPQTETEQTRRSAPDPFASGTQRLDILTPRESEVLNLLAEGNSTVQIASIMCVCTTTVRNHIQHMLNKLNVHTRYEAILLGKQLNRF